MRDKRLLRGIVAGAAGGLAASWVMNLFIAGPGKKLEELAENQNSRKQQPQEDATMKTADAIVSTATGGRHLSWEEKEKSGPVVHYAFGSLMGAFYGALAEYLPAAKAGFGTTFGTALFTGADVIAVPALKLAPPPNEQPISDQSMHLGAHIVYGLTTEMVRRSVRALI